MESSRRTPFTPSQLAREHIYTKIQVHYGGDIQDVVLKTDQEPTCRDLADMLEHTYRISVDHQLIFYRGQRLHHHYGRRLSNYGIFSGNLVSLVGKRGFL